MKTCKSLLLLLVVVLYAMQVAAQTTRATVSGKITDENDEPLIGAVVTVRNESTCFQLRAPTGEDGF